MALTHKPEETARLENVNLPHLCVKHGGEERRCTGLKGRALSGGGGGEVGGGRTSKGRTPCPSLFQVSCCIIRSVLLTDGLLIYLVQGCK